MSAGHHPRLFSYLHHYYPFGMHMMGLGKEGAPDHRFRFNQGADGKTFQALEGKSFKTERETAFQLGWDMTKYRAYDYQLGRFSQVDPKADMGGQESLTPYQFSFNNPIRYNDPMGDLPPIDTFWDLGNVIYDVVAAIYNHVTGDHQAAMGNWADAAADGTALMIPYVPAGATKLRFADDVAEQGAKMIDNVVESGVQNVDEAAEGSNKVYRALAKGEDPSKGLTARNPDATGVEPISHVAGKKESPWISTTKDVNVAKNNTLPDGFGRFKNSILSKF